MITISVLPEKSNTSLPPQVIKTVKNRLSHNAFRTFYYDDGSVKNVPMAKFGNLVYSYRQKIKALAYQAKLSPMLKIDVSQLKSTGIFLTAGTEYEKDNTTSTKNAHAKVKKQFPKLIRKLKKHGLIAHLEGFECHQHGGFHVHAVIVFDHSLKFFKDKKGVARHGTLKNLIKEYWEIGNVDVKGVMSESASGYVLKELSKSGSCEKAIQRYEKGEPLLKNDANRIWLTWLVEQTKCRTFGHSENLSISEDDLELAKSAEADRLDSIKTNSTDEKPTSPKIIASLAFHALQIHRLRWFIPWTGKVDPNSEMYRELWALCPADKETIAKAMGFRSAS